MLWNGSTDGTTTLSGWMCRGLFNCDLNLKVHERCMTKAPGAAAAADGVLALTPTPPVRLFPTPAMGDDDPALAVASVQSFNLAVEYTWERTEDRIEPCDPNSKPASTDYVSVCIGTLESWLP